MDYVSRCSTTKLADPMSASIKNLNMDPGVMGEPRGKLILHVVRDTASRSCDSPSDHHHCVAGNTDTSSQEVILRNTCIQVQSSTTCCRRSTRSYRLIDESVGSAERAQGGEDRYCRLPLEKDERQKIRTTVKIMCNVCLITIL